MFKMLQEESIDLTLLHLYYRSFNSSTIHIPALTLNHPYMNIHPSSDQNINFQITLCFGLGAARMVKMRKKADRQTCYCVSFIVVLVYNVIPLNHHASSRIY